MAACLIAVAPHAWAQEKVTATGVVAQEPQAIPGGASPRLPAEINPPLPSSQPVPSTIDPTTPPPAPTDSQSTFSGNTPVQDLSALLPGRFSNTKYKWYGFIRLDAIYDFKPIKSTDDLVTAAIPIPQGNSQNFVLTPRYTRLGFDTETPLESMDWTIKTRLEMDFFNGNTSGLFGSFPIRLRFAWVDFGPFLIGQAPSLFMDYDVFPNVLDYEGPPGMVLMRQPIISMHWKHERIKVSVGIEQPYSDIEWFENGAWVVNPGTGIITTPGVGKNVQNVPDFTGNVRYEGCYSHVQVAGIVRKLSFEDAAGATFDEVGYGINVTATWSPWAMLSGAPEKFEDRTPMQRSRFLGQYAAGRGINRYIQDVNGSGLDATFDPANGFRAIPSYGWFVAYEQWWTKRLASNYTVGGGTWSDLTNTLPANTYKHATYYSANLIWLPVERMGVGFEYLYGSRENFDGASANVHRLQFATQYKF
ncbi:MAG: DcaP family trimeric outer membrane transporter [Gemmataceae bacterium]